MATVSDRKPVRTYLKEREPLVPHKKLVDILGIDLGDLSRINYFTDLVLQQVPPAPPPLVDRVRPEDALEVMAASSWAHGLAEGVCGPGYVGLTPGTREYERCVYNVSHKVAAKAIGMVWTPPPAPPAVPPPRRPPRR